jgi:hypothetical protein
MNRRTFVKTTATLSAFAAKPTLAAPSSPRKLRKGIMYATIKLDGSVLNKFKAV